MGDRKLVRPTERMDAPGVSGTRHWEERFVINDRDSILLETCHDIAPWGPCRLPQFLFNRLMAGSGHLA